MSKKPIRAVICELLARASRPMSAREIYEHIVGQGLYEFKAKDPASIVRGQLRRHCVGVKGGAQMRYFKMTGDGLFALLESPQAIADDMI